MNDIIDMTENEYRLLLAVESGEAASQRKLSEKLNISLGMINLCLRRLIKQGYIKTHGLNKRKVQYLLTPKGFSEKMRKTYHYTQKTMNELARIKENIQNEIKARYLSGERNFTVAGTGELSDLAEIAIKNLKYGDIVYKRKEEGSADVLIAAGEKLPLMSLAAKL
ncbi:winged helix-turn-helix transcriptional regulator [bacterium]|nr:winged helix-turn-helix transcriptional regulator [Candidatus Omnitrophota bacterium]MBU2529217.1 winged helix-turn-helix transcriptional regulator [bacterium]MBU3930491.1 winged helix-turn-helix transcriptional regulator [bacterium]MBU4122505.1 winged helix-turn-helix transcriptional regulator [bacterium]